MGIGGEDFYWGGGGCRWLVVCVCEGQGRGVTWDGMCVCMWVMDGGGEVSVRRERMCGKSKGLCVERNAGLGKGWYVRGGGGVGPHHVVVFSRSLLVGNEWLRLCAGGHPMSTHLGVCFGCHG